VILHDETTPRMLGALRARQHQVALMMQPPRQSATGIVFIPLTTFPVVLATAGEHRFARKRQVALADIVSEPFVVFSRSEYSEYHALLRRVLGRNYEQLRIVEECDTGMSLIAGVEANRGVALTIETLRVSAGKRLRFIPIMPRPDAAMGVAYLAETPTSAAHAFVEVLKAVAAQPRAANAASTEL
jgi:DNA-binding transcriptional LysR family regulator